MRLATPELLVDITGLRELATIERRNGSLRIGALVKRMNRIMDEIEKILARKKM